MFLFFVLRNIRSQSFNLVQSFRIYIIDFWLDLTHVRHDIMSGEGTDTNSEALKQIESLKTDFMFW